MERTIDWNRISVFLKVVEDGGFTAAARGLRLPKSSVSRSVALLEKELGARLLQRSTRKVELTEAGRIFYDRASRALSGVEEAALAVADLQTSPTGLVRFTAPLDAGVALLAPLLAEFLARHPGVQVEAMVTNRVVDLVGEGVDFALRVAPQQDSSLVARRLRRIDTGVVASPAYLARRGTPKQVSELAEHDCLLFRPERGRARWTLACVDSEASVEVKGALAADDYTFLRRAVQAGIGIALMPLFVIDDLIESGELVRLFPTFKTQHGYFHLVYPSAHYLPQRSVVFRDFLIERLGDHANDS
jgi:DNA-binding transcriptional LysR family regulator